MMIVDEEKCTIVMPGLCAF